MQNSEVDEFYYVNIVSKHVESFHFYVSVMETVGSDVGPKEFLLYHSFVRMMQRLQSDTFPNIKQLVT